MSTSRVEYGKSSRIAVAHPYCHGSGDTTVMFSSSSSKHALMESETRRLMLVEKMKEAHETITLQSKRLSDTERLEKEKRFEVEESKFKEKEYLRKIQRLEMDLSNLEERQRHLLKYEDDKQSKIDTLDSQLENLKEVNHLLKFEFQTSQNELNGHKNNIKQLEDIVESFTKTRDIARKESTVLQDNLQTAQIRIQQLEDQLRNNQIQLDKLQEVNEGLSSENKETHRQLLNARNNNTLQKDKIILLNNQIQDLNNAVEDHSRDLNEYREKLKRSLGDVANLDKSNQTAIQQHHRFKQDIKNIEIKLRNSNETSDLLLKEKVILEEEISKQRDSIRNLEAEKISLFSKLSEMETQKNIFENEMKRNNAELNSFKNKSEKLAKEVACKEMEIKNINKKVEDFENEVDLLKSEKISFEFHTEELDQIRQQLLRSEDETRRLLQERVENQQMIELLEVQKDVLLKLYRPGSQQTMEVSLISSLAPTIGFSEDI